MGCVQSLFNPSKSRSPSPDKDFAPPAFETVVVTRQPQTLKKSNDGGAGYSTEENDDIVTKCRDFEQYAIEEDVDNLSIHFVEATATRTLAANTGSVAILGTTAKCKSVGSSPAVRQPTATDQHEMKSPPSSGIIGSQSQPQLRSRFVDATAVRTLAAETGSIAIIGVTATPNPDAKIPLKKTRESTGSIHYVEATAVRHLAANTGSIVILSSTAIQQPIVKDQDDFDCIPVGVREVLDSEPAQLLQEQQEELKQEQKLMQEPETKEELGKQQQLDSDSQIPLPVIYAMEMKPIAQVPDNVFRPVSSEKHILPPRSMTIDSAIPGRNSAFGAPSRKPLLRQSHETGEKDNDEWLPKIPVFAKCLPAKSRSLPSKDTTSTGQSIPGEENGENQHSRVVRGSSLPYNSNNNQAEKLLNYSHSGSKNDTFEPNIVQIKMGLLKESNIASENVEGSTIAIPKVKESIEVLPKDEDSNLFLQEIKESIVIPSQGYNSVNDQSTDSTTALPKIKKTNISSSKEEESNIVSSNIKELNIVSPNNKESTFSSSKVEESNISLPNVEEAIIMVTSNIEKSNNVPQKVEEAIVVASSMVVSPNELNIVLPKVEEEIAVISAVEKSNVPGKNVEVSTIDQSINQNSSTVQPKFKDSTIVSPYVENPTVIGPKVEELTVSLIKVEESNTAPVTVEDSKVVPRSNGNNNGEKTVSENVSKMIIKNNKTTETTDFVDGEKFEKLSLVPTVEKSTKEENIREEVAGHVQKLDETSNIDAEVEFRLTMIQSVREAVNRICEQAVEKTAAIVSSGRGRPNVGTTASLDVHDKRDADDSEAADCASSEFSLPPPPIPPSDMISMGQESSWPPPPPQSEVEEERTIAPSGFSFDLPDPPTEMDHMDSETDKLDISDEEMRATGLPSDDEDKTDTDTGEENGEMKSTTANVGGGGEATTVESSVATRTVEPVVVVVDNGADDRAATTIQAVYRGFRARKYVETVHAAAVKIQAGFRGYRVRQSLKNAAPSTATTNTDDSQCWSDDDQKSVVSVTYAPLKDCDAAASGPDRVLDIGEGMKRPDDDGDDRSLVAGDDEVFVDDNGKKDEPAKPSSARLDVVDVNVNADDDDDDVRALTDAAIKIQSRIRGFVVRKRLNDEKNAIDKQ